MAEKIHLAVFISGGGSNLQSIIDCCHEGEIPAEVSLVVSNKEDAYGLVRAKQAGIDRLVFYRNKFPDSDSAGKYLLSKLQDYNIDMIALAGYLRKLPPTVVRNYRELIVNIHPALLPKYGGKGMYGLNVHRAVIEAKEKESGVSIHYVDEIYDHGEVIAQDKVPVLPEDTPEELAARVLKLEHSFYPKVLKELSEKMLKERKL
jgi:formyltetrahydrofolate-dependent phosphoribosylglycinamide formyltransferase